MVISNNTQPKNYGERLERTRLKCIGQKLDALLVTHLPNIRWLTGFTGSNAQLLITDRRALFFTDPRYDEQAHAQVRDARIIVVPRRSLTEEIVHRRLMKNIRRLGVEELHMPLGHYLVARKGFAPTRLIATKNLVEELRAVKTATDIDAIRRATEVTDKAYNDILALVVPGMTEKQLATEITYRQLKYGAEKDAFEPIVLSGQRTSLIHGMPSSKKIREHDAVLVDFGCVVDGYHSDMTRVFFLGAPRRDMKLMYGRVLDAQRRTIDAVCEGVIAKDLDAVPRASFRTHGIDKYFTHSTGHGLGLEVHELPRVAWNNAEPLVSGNVITIEPGLYVPSVGGVRIEDDVVVTASGCDVLNRSSKEIIVVD